MEIKTLDDLEAAVDNGHFSRKPLGHGRWVSAYGPDVPAHLTADAIRLLERRDPGFFFSARKTTGAHKYLSHANDRCIFVRRAMVS